MGLSKWAAVFWLVGAVMAIAVTVVFRIDALQWVLTIAAAVAAAVIGILLLRRPGASIVSWSNATGSRGSWSTQR
jgi:UPF0716 family protein affecting phage T7 exclusion